MRSDGRFLGRVESLTLGPNVLTAKLSRNHGARVTITNHLQGGPVFSGPQIQPWTCFAGAFDPQCNRQVDYEFFYQPTAGGGLQSYDPESPPDDVATTTTDQGQTVPFIVRQETGSVDRDEYRIAVLYDPAKPFEPWAPQRGFNHKLVIVHGASCDTGYEQASAPDVLNDDRSSSTQVCARVRRDVARAEQLRPQLQRRRPGRGDDDGEGARDRAIRRAPLHDRLRLLRRCARAAAGRKRLPRHLSGDHAGLLLPGHVVGADAVRGLLAATPLLREPDELGARRRVDDARHVGGDGPSELRELDRLQHGDLRAARPEPQLPGRGCGRRLRPGDQRERSPLLAPGLHGQHLRPPFERRLRRPAVGQHRSRVRPQSADRRKDHGGPVRGRQLQDRRPRHRLRAAAGSRRRRPARAAARVPQRRGRPGHEPRPGRDHRPARPGSRRLPRRIPDVRVAGAAGTRARDGARTRSSGAAASRWSATPIIRRSR